MAATQKLFPTTRTERQIQRLGIGPWALTPAAVELFARRQRLRLWLQWGIAAPALATVAVMLWNSKPTSDDIHTAAFDSYGFRTGFALALFGCSVVVFTEIRRRCDRRIASSLPTRVTRVERVPVTTVLGRVRTVYFAMALIIDLTFAVALFAVRRDDVAAYRWGYVCAFAFCALSAVVGIAREVSRPALAPDAVSLVIDERMRSQEAFAAIAPLMILGNLAGYGFIPFLGSGRIGEIGFVLPLLPMVLWGFASEAKPWPKPQPAPWLAQPAQQG